MEDHRSHLPGSVSSIDDHQKAIPRIAKDKRLVSEIEGAVHRIPTTHRLFRSDARRLMFIKDQSVHLVLTSPPYWTLKKYREHTDQLGAIEDY